MNVLGIDYSTKAIDLVGIASDNTRVHWWHFDLSGHDAFERLREVGNVMPAAAFWTRFTAVGIEEPMSRGVQSIQLIPKLKAVQGAIVASIPRQVLVAPLRPNDWKASCGLSGSASKDVVATWARAEMNRRDSPIYSDVWPQETVLVDFTQDALDAYCIARATADRVVVTA